MREINLEYQSEKNLQTKTTFAYIYDINYSGEQSPLTAKEGNIEDELMNPQQKKKRQNMEPKKAILFSEQEKVFRERTGKDFSSLYTKYYPKLVYFTAKITNDPQ
jgi:hypothetical protein